MEILDIKKGSMRNSAFDMWLIFFPLSLALMSATILTERPEYTFLLLAGVFWVSSNIHAFMTYIKVLWNKPNRDKYIYFLTIVPLLILTVCIALWSWTSAAVLISLYYYIQLFHYVRQSYGLSTIYKRPSNDKTPVWLHQGAIYLFPVWGLLISMHEGFSFFGSDVYSFSIGEFPLLITSLVTFAICILWLIYQAKGLLKNEFSVWYFLFMLSHFIVFYIGLIYFEDKMQGWICMAFWHGTQYVIFIWNHFQYISNKHTDGDIELLKFLTKNIFLFCFLSLILAGLFIGALKLIFNGTILWAVPVFFAITLMLNFNHYILDALIWRRPKKTAE